MDATSQEKKRLPLLTRFRNNIRRRLIAGVLVVVPLWMTYIALKFFLRMLDGFFAPIIKRLLGFSVPGLGFALLLIFIYLIGMIATNILGRTLIGFGEAILNRIPLVKNIYQAAKQLVHTISLSKSMGFKRVVLLEYPRPGIRVLAFVTNSVENEHEQHGKKRFETVFIPHTPSPTSGFLQLVPADQLIETNLTVEEGLKMVISGGLVSPKQFSLQSDKPRFPWS